MKINKNSTISNEVQKEYIKNNHQYNFENSLIICPEKQLNIGFNEIPDCKNNFNTNINEEIKSIEEEVMEILDLKFSENQKNVNNCNRIINDNIQINSNQISVSCLQKGSLLFDKVRERKSYEDKFLILQNRIKKLKEQESELNRKLKLQKMQLTKFDKIRGRVEEDKKKLLSEKELRKAEKEKLKQELLQEKEMRRQKLNEAKEAYKKEKEKKIQLVKKDKLLLQSIAGSMKMQTENKKIYNCFKNRQEELGFKINRFKKFKEKEDEVKEKFDSKIIAENNKTMDIKKKIEELEELELDYMKRLETTITRNKSEIDSMLRSTGMNYLNSSFKLPTSLHESYTNTNILIHCPSLPKIEEQTETHSSNFKNKNTDEKETGKKSLPVQNKINTSKTNKLSVSDNKITSDKKDRSQKKFSSAGNSTGEKPKIHPKQANSSTNVKTNYNSNIKLGNTNEDKGGKKENNEKKNIKFRKNNSTAVFEKKINSNYNTIQTENHGIYDTYVETSKNIISSPNITKRKNAKISNTIYKSVDDKVRKEFNKSQIKCNTSLHKDKQVYVNTEVVKKINFDEKQNARPKISNKNK